jgi:DNA-binding response OmpR family regulator
VPPPPRRRTRTTVLVVEDDARLRNYYRSLLTLEGYVVLTAEDGVDALERVEDHQVGAVILDLGLPRLAGEDVSRELASHPRLSSIPVIVVTGRDTADVDMALYRCVLRKPVSPDALLKAVNECVRGA